MFDDGSQGILDKNHNFRTKFENELRKGYSLHDYEKQDNELGADKEKTPMVLIVVQGGFSTLKSIEEALKNETPVLLIAVCFFFFLLNFLKLFNRVFFKHFSTLKAALT